MPPSSSIKILCHIFNAVFFLSVFLLCAKLNQKSQKPIDEQTLQLIDDSYYEFTVPKESMEDKLPLGANLFSTDDGYEDTASGGDYRSDDDDGRNIIVRNELNLGTVQQSNHHQLFLCRTSNSNLTKPLDVIVQIEIYSKYPNESESFTNFILKKNIKKMYSVISFFS